MIRVSENEEKYSAYMSYISAASNRFALFAAFMFAGITIFLTQYSNPSEPIAQIVLLVFTVMLDLFLYRLMTMEWTLSNCVRIAPPIPQRWMQLKQIGFESSLELLGWILLSAVPALMYLPLNLSYLSLASLGLSAFFILVGYFTYGRPYDKYAKKHPYIRK